MTNNEKPFKAMKTIKTRLKTSYNKTMQTIKTNNKQLKTINNDENY